MPDPVRRREVLVQRLQAAIKVCQDAGEIARALRFVLIGADAKGAEHATRNLMTKYSGLTAKFAPETASRLILGNPDAIQSHGALLSNLIAEDAVRGDAISAREDRRRFNAWLGARRDAYQAEKEAHKYAEPWPVSPEDVAAVVYATMVLDGIDKTMARHGRIRPDAFGGSVLRNLVARLMAEGRLELVEGLAAKLKPVWAVFVYVPLAMAGRAVDLARLAEGLETLKRRFRLNANWLSRSNSSGDHRAAVIDIALSAAEILVAAGAAGPASESVFKAFRDPDVRRRDRLHYVGLALLDAILRSCTLADALAGVQTTVDTILAPRLAPPEERRRSRSDEARKDREVEEVVQIVLGFYALRAKTLIAGRPDSTFAETLVKAQQHFEAERWRLESRPMALDIRNKASECLTVLLAAEADPALVMAAAVKLRSGWASHYGVAPTRLFERLAAVPSLHPELVQSLALAAQKIKDARVGAERKAQSLAAFAQFMAIISPHDAEVVFKDAVNAASELDSEIAQQLLTIGEFIEQGLPAFGNQSRPCALALAEVVHDAAVRLEHNRFRWSEAFTALARLDFPVALAAAARWSDTGRAKLSDSLRPITTVGLDQRQLAVADTAALFGLIVKPDSEQLEPFVACAEQDGPATAAHIAEELARDLLVDRIEVFDALSMFISRHGQGPSAARLAAQSNLVDKLTRAAEEQSEPHTPESPQHTRTSYDVLEAQTWAVEDLVDAQRLAHVVAEVTTRSRAQEQYPTDEAIHKAARDAVPFIRRLDHLKALSGTPARLSVAEPLLAALSDWATQLAIKQWAIDNLPALIVERLPDFVTYLPWEDERLSSALSFAQANGDEIPTLLLRGIARHADDLSPSVTLSLVRLIGAHLKPSEAAELAQWYVERLKGRIASIHLEGPSDSELPKSVAEALARFLYAHLSDVDVRVRWRAAHSLRRLARFGRTDILSAVVAQHERLVDAAFRDPDAPFYALAARLWLVIALDRIAEETPAAAAPHGDFLLQTALNKKLPHLLIRDYAADACRKLAAAGLLQLAAEDLSALAAVNQSALPRATGKIPHERGRHRDAAPGSRFHFDSMDTLPYWFEPWVSVFEGLTYNDFQQEAERWIVDEWGVQDDPPYGSQEPRTRRFAGVDYGLTSHRHGSEPVVERHRRYLEWHAMWCTAGTFLGTHRLAPVEEWGEDPFSYRLARGKLTVPPVWLSDLVGPTPLEARYWRQNRVPGPNWLQAISNEGFHRELRAVDHPGYLVVAAATSAKWLTFEQTVRVSTGLVSPETAHALVRALQSYHDPSDYYICPEGHNLEIDAGEFRLKGWIRHSERDSNLDDADVYRNGVRHIDTAPGKMLTAALTLERRLSPAVGWWRPKAEQPALVYEEWGEPERDEENRGPHGEAVTSRGHRLLIREADLQAFLAIQGLDLIAEVEIARHDRRNRSSTFDEEDSESATFDRLFLLRSDGRLQAAERDLGTWRTDSSGT